MDINRVIIVGNLTRDPDLRYTPGGTAVANFTLAVNDGYGDKQTVDFIRVTAWGKTAENVTNYCPKGSKVAVDGRLKQQNYEDKNGNKREKVYVNAQQIMFLNAKRGQQNEGYGMGSDSIREEDVPF
jgi:single-strand DNA-binding protein